MGRLSHCRFYVGILALLLWVATPAWSASVGPLSLDELRELTLWLRQVEKVEPFQVPHDAITGDAVLGAQVYQENCAACHGASGEGGTGTALGNPVMLGLTPDAFLRHAIADYLKRERAYVAEAGRELSEYGPFRKTDDA